MTMATYVYCLVASPRKPSLARVPPGLARTGPVRLLDAPAQSTRTARGGSKWWLVVADAPLPEYGEASINKRLNDLDWVSRAAVAHEAVIETFIGAAAVLPMKLFTMFASDDRARAYVDAERPRIARIVQRVAGHHEFGVRVTLNRSKTVAPKPDARIGRSGGAGYLAQKKAQRDAVSELARRARETVSALFDVLAPLAAEARRRGASELPAQGGPLLLDAVFLVRASREPRFRRLVDARARELTPAGYDVSITGPWPPYGFVQE